MKFAFLDVVGGEQFYEKFFTFSYSEPFNANFEKNDVGETNFLPNSGSSLFPVYAYMIIHHLTMKLLHVLAIHSHHIKCCQNIGLKVHKANQANFFESSEVYFFEAFLELCLCIFLQFYQMRLNHHNMKEIYFTRFSDIL